MKKYISLAALVSAAAMSTTAYAAELTKIATMDTLADTASVPTDTTLAQAVDVSSYFTTGNTVYEFNGNQGLLGIKNDDLTTALSQTSGYLTVAAWVYAGSVREEAIFSFGEQNTGAKFSFKDGAMLFTTKGVADTKTSLDGISTGEWTFVAWSLALDKTSSSGVYVNDNSLTTEVKAGSWNLDDNAGSVFAIGSANANTGVTPEGSDTQVIRDGFDGLIANLTVFTSDSLATNDEIITAMGTAGGAPIYTWNGGAEGNWDTSSTNWLFGGSPTNTTYVNVATSGYAAEAHSVKFEEEVSVTIAEAIKAGSVTISADTTFSIAEAGSLTVGNLHGGADVSLTKEGAGELTLSSNGGTFSGELVIESGTVKIGSQGQASTGALGVQGTNDGGRYAAIVKTGATLDLNGYADNGYRIDLAGGTLTNSGNKIGDSSRQTIGIKVSAAGSKVTVQEEKNFALLASEYAATKLDLGGYTLTKDGAGTFGLTATEITAGVLEVKEGAVSVRNSEKAAFSMADGAMIKLNGGTLQALGKASGDNNTVTIGDVGVVLADTTTAILTANGGQFAAGTDAKLYLDISKVTLSGEKFALLEIVGANAFTADGFYSNILVGEWDSESNWITSSEWEYKSFAADTGHLTLTAIPEPSAFGLLAGLGALALVASRRRRK